MCPAAGSQQVATSNRPSGSAVTSTARNEPASTCGSSLGGKEAITRDSLVSRSMTTTSPRFVSATIWAGKGAGDAPVSDEEPVRPLLDFSSPQPARASAKRKLASACPSRRPIAVIVTDQTCLYRRLVGALIHWLRLVSWLFWRAARASARSRR